MLVCPFCGAPETDRFSLEGHRFLVFRCLFSPEVEEGLTDEEIRERLQTFAAQGSAYFRGTCDRLHLYVTKGEGARALGAEPTAPDPRTGA
ncbi:MAG TPA: hypothetical protein VJ021_05000 [Thermoplasmata archaeon]|nr:hypothetical protein [Thermoplasmata archaeon]